MKRYKLFILLLISGCSKVETKKTDAPQSHEDRRKFNFGSIVGDEILIFGGDKKSSSNQLYPNVNPYLWRASLDVLSFMPLVSADAVGGVIVTDWYNTNDSEKIKVNVYIKDKVLRADALKIQMFKQIKKQNDWINAECDNKKSRELENIILNKARNLKIQE